MRKEQGEGGGRGCIRRYCCSVGLKQRTSEQGRGGLRRLLPPPPSPRFLFVSSKGLLLSCKISLSRSRSMILPVTAPYGAKQHNRHVNRVSHVVQTKKPELPLQVGSSTGQDVASTLTADSGISGGDVVVCGSTTGGLFEDPGFSFEGGSADAGVEGPADRGTEAFCAKLGALDGHVRYVCFLLCLLTVLFAFVCFCGYYLLLHPIPPGAYSTAV